MSKMDGYELCRKIKTDVLLSHIPVVILTAKVTDQDKITGYQEGADVYMTKPFNPTLLQTVIDNLLTSRSKLREMLLSGAGQPDSEPEDAEETGEIRLSAADRAFVDKLRQYVDANISDSSLSISDISAEMCMSRASFFRKIKSLTGVTPNNFILIYRLNKAAAMIRSREYRLNEIADLEHIRLDDGAELQLAAVVEGELAQVLLGGNAGLVEMADFGLGQLLFSNVLIAQLDCLITILLGGLLLGDDTGARFDHGDRDHVAVFVEDLRHANFFADDCFHV